MEALAFRSRLDPHSPTIGAVTHATHEPCVLQSVEVPGQGRALDADGPGQLELGARLVGPQRVEDQPRGE